LRTSVLELLKSADRNPATTSSHAKKVQKV
jgi:hypothetical protein